MQAIVTAIAAASKIYATIDRKSPIDPTTDIGETIDAVRFEGSLEFRQIKHVYPSRPDILAMDSVSFIAPANKLTALVGTSGSGKSTVVGLIERFYEPLEGDILLDGVPITQLKLQWLRQQIGFVSQEPVLFATTILQNIRQGLVGTKYEALADDDQQLVELVISAAKVVYAHEFICNLADGYETHVGERGSLLSGGQKQRIAIARAVVSNPKILIMDEATSALDVRSEGMVQAALDQASRDRTTIIIAHRLSTIKQADNIIVMSRGRIVEQGTHNGLISINGAYSRLVEAQSILEHHEQAGDGQDYAPVAFADRTTAAVVNEQRRGKSLNEKELDAELELNSNLVLSKKSSQYSFWRLAAFVGSFNAPDWPYMSLGMLCAVITGAGIPVQSVFFAKSIAFLALPQNTEARSQVSFWSWMFLILALVQLIAYLIQAYVMAWCSEKLVHRARSAWFKSVLRQEVAFFDHAVNSSGALTSFISTSSNVRTTELVFTYIVPADTRT